MALETLKGVTEIGGFPIVVMDELREKFPDKFNESGSMDYEWFEKDIRPNYFVYIRHDKNSISFTLQHAPIQEAKISCMLPDFEHYLILKQPEGAMWEEEALHQHAAKCIEENSQDWQDFCSLYGNDYTGVNGCQVDTLIHAALIMLEGLDKEVPSDWNKRAITNLRYAIYSLEDRKQERENRGVEGTSKE